MTYPPRYFRQHNFARDASNGVDLVPGKIDVELNAVQVALEQLNTFMRAITTSSATLRGTSTATAMALVGEQTFTATASQTIFTTTIAWDASFTTASVHVIAQGLRLAPTAYTVADASGFLRVTLSTGRTVGDVVIVDAFSAGAGISTRLASTSVAGDGADLVGVYDAGGLYTASTVEDALQEVKLALDTLISDLGPLTDYIQADGSIPMTGDLEMGGQNINDLAAASAPGQAVEFSQFNAYVGVWNALQDFFMKLDGTTPMQAVLPMGNQRITDLADADTTSTGDQHATNVRTVKALLGTAGGLPIGAVIPYGGDTAPTGWLLCDGEAYTVAAQTALYAVIGTAFGNGGGAGFNVPDLRGRTILGVGTGDYTAPFAAGGVAAVYTRGLEGGKEATELTFAQMPTHQHTVPFLLTGDSGGGADNGGTGNTTAMVDSAVDGAPHDNRMPFVAMNYIIKAA